MGLLFPVEEGEEETGVPGGGDRYLFHLCAIKFLPDWPVTQQY